MTLEGKVALVTGGARGIGRAIADRFLAEGAEVLACGRGERPGDLPGRVGWHTADVSGLAGVGSLRDAVESAHGRLHVLVNNAGVQVEKTVVDTTDEDWELLAGTNMRGVFLCCRAFIPMIARSGGGSVVNIGSISGNVADPGMALYNASKSFVHGLTRSIAADHGSEGVRCNAICPGWIMTGMADAAFGVARDPRAAQEDALARHPAGRLGRPSDIAGAALWLASEESAFVTGQTFVVDGGLTAASPLNPALF